jgi:hypothetical protein
MRSDTTAYDIVIIKRDNTYYSNFSILLDIPKAEQAWYVPE